MNKERIRTATPQPYTCICGTVITHKRKSLKKHLLTQTHIRLAPCPPHHWIIESAQGHFSNGYCQNCKEQKTFENSINGYTWVGRAQRTYEDEEKKQEQKEEITQLVN